MSYDAPVLQITSHVAGKNAIVRVYPDRVEWEKPKSMSGGKMTAAVLTVGLSTAVTGGVKSRKGAGTEIIFMRSITSVTTRRDSMINDVVSVVTAGNTIDMRCSKKEAEALKAAILAGINGTLSPASVTPVPAAAPTPPPAGPPAGWYPDPHGGVGLQRYWDGKTWTEHTHQG